VKFGLRGGTLLRVPPSPISSLARHCEDAILPSPPTEPAELTALVDLLSTIPDPRRVRGRRYRLGSLLALCLVAVLGGACSLAQIARFATDSAPICARSSACI
jgi:hypothetical protein